MTPPERKTALAAVMLALASVSWVGAEPHAYRRPNLQAELFDTNETGLTDDVSTKLVDGLARLARNFPDAEAIDHRIRTRILGVALMLSPDHRGAVVANGQLARGITPTPLAPENSLKSECVGIHETAVNLRDSTTPTAIVLSDILLDLLVSIDKSYRGLQELSTRPAIDWSPLEVDNNPPKPPPAPTVQFRTDTTEIRMISTLGGRIETLPICATAVVEPSLKLFVDEANSPFSVIGHRSNKTLDFVARQHANFPTTGIIDLALERDGSGSNVLAAALAIDALAKGSRPDPRAVIGGDLSLGDGSIARLSAAFAMTMAALGKDKTISVAAFPCNEEEAFDFALLQNHTVFLNVQVCRISNFREARTFASADRPPLIAKSLATFADVRENPEHPRTTARLREIVSQNPNHISARYLLAAAEKKLPKFVSLRGSVAEIERIGKPTINRARNLSVRPAPGERTPYGTAATALGRLRSKLHPDARKLSDVVVDLSKIYDSLAFNQPTSDIGRQRLNVSIREKLAAIHRASRALKERIRKGG